MKTRGSGILLHISSLPSPFGIGDLGPGAYRFLDFLSRTKQGFWQILPLNPTDPIEGNSPYSSASAFAYNPLLISPECMIKDGFLTRQDCKPLPDFPKQRVDYDKVIDYKQRLLDVAYQRFRKKTDKSDYEKFCLDNAYWLDDFALFIALKGHFPGRVWSDWPREIRDRQADALEGSKKQFQDRVEREKLLQYIFFRQWISFRRYCNQKNIRIIGDIPIYVKYDSADVWSNPGIFKLNEEKKPDFIAGVPPDYFSRTGQLWGNPVYRWEALQQTGYNWWIQRIGHILNLYDLVRVDHFRGLVAYWEVPAGEKTAINGQWIRVPAEDFFNTLLKHFSSGAIIAEDLGHITPDVRQIVRRFEFPGMKVLLFAFNEDNPAHPYLPHTYEKLCVVYTGTHDNNTIAGWFKKDAGFKDKARLFRYLGREVPAKQLHWELIRLAMASVANTVIFPMQDILGLDQAARMNKPAKTRGNWQWRILPRQLGTAPAKKLLEMTKIYGRV